MTKHYREAYTVLRGAAAVFLILGILAAVATIPVAVYLNSWQVGKYGLAVAGCLMGASISLAVMAVEGYGRELDD